MIETKDLVKSFEGFRALDGLTMTVPTGSVYGLVGPNGAGKSTLLKSLMGLIKADTGHIEWQGLRRQDIAYLPQQSDIDRGQPMSVYELAAMGLWYEIGFFGKVNAAQHARIQAALAQVEMADFAKRPIGQLSNGQFQRVLFARMLVQNAKVLLLDEPFNAVDAKTTFALLEVLRQYHSRQHCTVVAVLHDYEQVRAYFPNTLLLAREKVAAGRTEAVLTDSHLQQANIAMQKHDSDEWCAA